MKKIILLVVLMLFVSFSVFAFQDISQPEENELATLLQCEQVGITHLIFAFYDIQTSFGSLNQDNIQSDVSVSVNHKLYDRIGVEGCGECLEIYNLIGSETAFDVSLRKQVMIETELIFLWYL